MNASMNAASASAPSSIESERRAHEPSMEEILASIRKIIADDDALPLSRPSTPPRLFEGKVTQFAPPPPPAGPAQAAPSTADDGDGVNDVAEARLDASENVRLDATEMESFAEVGRELARLESPAEAEADVAVEQGGDGLRPALDAADQSAAREEPQVVVAQAVVAEDVAVQDGRRDANDMEDEVIASEYGVDDRASDALREQDERMQDPSGEFERASGYEPTDRDDLGAILSAEANASVASAFQALSASVQMASAEAIDRQVRDMLRPMLKQWLDDNLPVMVERLVRAEIERVARGGR